MTDLKHVVCPKCGKCGEKIFDGHPTELTDQIFQKHVARNDVPVVVDFWAPWALPISCAG